MHILSVNKMQHYYFLVIIQCIICNYVVTSLWSDTGKPAGLMGECPGMNRTVRFSKKTRDSLSVVAICPTTNIFESGERRCRMSEEGAKCVAEVVDLKKRRTQVVISGYLSASFSLMVRSLVNIYLVRGQNVIVVEIFPLLYRSYPIELIDSAARMTKPLGELVGDFLAALSLEGLSPKRLSLIGGSLGAHVASYASVRYRELTGRQPARLTGLDPAGPCFRNLPQEVRFNRYAAKRVDALHTNIDGFGIADPVAQVDFYANGGEFQPSLTNGFVLPCFQLCSHVRAAFYWMEAYLNTEGFVAVRCDSVSRARSGDCYDKRVEYNLLGPKTNFSKPGVYYLPVNSAPPYAKGQTDNTASRQYGINNYLLKSSPDEDITI